jgi:hypothetical protein
MDIGTFFGYSILEDCGYERAERKGYVQKG